MACDDEQLFAQLADYEIVDLRDWRDDYAGVGARVREVDIAITNRHSPTLLPELAADPGRLRYICHTRGVVHAYFCRELLEAGIRLTNWGDAAKGVADKALALLLAALQQIPQLDRLCQGGVRGTAGLIWRDFPTSLTGFKLGIYGCGNIGRHMVRLCQGLGMELAAYDPWQEQLPDGVRRCESLADLFRRSYAVSIHAGLGESTQASVGAAECALLPRGGILINTARGDIVREAELADLVADGRLSCGLDVVAHEGDWSQSPLAGLDQVVLTGHGRRAPRPADLPAQAWVLPQYAIDNIRAFLAGEPLRNEITAELYDRTT